MATRRKAYAGALALLIGGMLTALAGFRGIIGPVLIGVALLLLHRGLGERSRVLARIGLGLSVVGLAFAAAVAYIPYFYQLRMTEVSSLPPDGAGSYLAGICLFFLLIAALAMGLVFLGAASLRAEEQPRALGILLIFGGLTSVSPQLLGSVLGVAGLVWLIWTLRKPRGANALEGRAPEA